MAALYEGTANEHTNYRMGELEFLAQSGSTPSPLDNLLDLPKHLQLQGILELLKPVTDPMSVLQRDTATSETLLEMEYKAIQELSRINSATEEKGLHEFLVNIHIKLFEKLAPLGPNVIADVEADEEFDAALIGLYRSAYKKCFNSDKETKEEVANSLLHLVVPFYIAHKGDRTKCLERIELLTKKFDTFKETKPQITPSSMTIPWWKEKFSTKAKRVTLVHGAMGVFLSFIGFGFAINNNGRMEFSLLFGEGGIIAALLIWLGVVLVIRSILILLTPYQEWLNGK